MKKIPWQIWILAACLLYVIVKWGFLFVLKGQPTGLYAIAERARAAGYNAKVVDDTVNITRQNALGSPPGMWYTYTGQKEDPYKKTNMKIAKETSAIYKGLARIVCLDTLLPKAKFLEAISVYNFNDIGYIYGVDDSGEMIQLAENPKCFNFCNTRMDMPVNEFRRILDQKPEVTKMNIHGGYACGAQWAMAVMDSKYYFLIACGFYNDSDELVFCMDVEGEKVKEYRFPISREFRSKVTVTEYKAKCYDEIAFNSFSPKL
jgi:hypothetical protein